MNQKIINEFTNIINYYKTLPSEFIKDNKLNYKIKIFQNFLIFVKKLNFEIKQATDLNQFIDKKIGIGKGIIKRVAEIIKYGYIKELKYNKYDLKYDELLKKLEDIYGIGIKNAKELIKQYNIKDIDEFIRLVNKKKIKIDDNIKKGIFYHDKIKNNIPRENIKKFKKNFIKSLDTFNNIKIKFCGSFRRKLKYSNDIDILIVSKDIINIDDLYKSKILYKIIDKLKKDKIIYDDLTIENIHTKYSGIVNYINELYRIDIRFLPYESYYSGLLYFTGSKLFNIDIRKKAKRLGYKLNEYGLYKDDKIIEIKSEKDIFKYLNLDYLKPNLRNY